jgi:hypothetical protein
MQKEEKAKNGLCGIRLLVCFASGFVETGFGWDHSVTLNLFW